MWCTDFLRVQIGSGEQQPRDRGVARGETERQVSRCDRLFPAAVIGLLTLVSTRVACCGEEPNGAPGGDTAAALYGFYDAFGACAVRIERPDRIGLVWYNETGVRFAAEIDGAMRAAYDRLAAAENLSALRTFFSERVLSDLYYVDYLDSASGVAIAMMGALFRISPEVGRQVAIRVMMSWPFGGCPFYNAPIEAERWPTLHRACLYFLLRDREPEAVRQLLSQVEASCPCPLTLADAVLLGQASAMERDYFLKNGDWPDPDKVAGCEFLSKVKKDAMRIAVEEEHLFPKTPIFLFLRVWRGSQRSNALQRILEEARGFSGLRYEYFWPVFAYASLCMERNTEVFRRVSQSERLIPQVYGVAGLIECLARDGKFDWESVDEAFARVVDGTPVGGEVLDFLGVRWETGFYLSFLENHAHDWFRLSTGRSKPSTVTVRIARLAVIAHLYASPVDPVSGLGEVLIGAFDQKPGVASEERVQLECVDMDLLAATRSDEAYEWIARNMPRWSTLNRIAAIHACRHFGKKKWNSLARSSSDWGEEEKRALAEVGDAISRIERAKEIVSRFHRERLSLDQAAVEIASLEHAAVLPWIWELMRKQRGNVSMQARSLLREKIRRCPTRDYYFVEYWIRKRLAMEGLAQE